MSHGRSGNRFGKTLLAALLLAACSAGYIWFSSLWLDVERNQRRPMSAQPGRPADTMNFEPTIFDSFAEDAWERKASKRYRYQGRYLFTKETRPVDVQPDARGARDGVAQLLHLSPLTVLWQSDRPDRKPFVIQAAEAEVGLSRKMSALQDAGQDCRIVSFRLLGKVTIRGPKNLQITGNDFRLHEKTMKLISRQPVEFTWETHRGSAKNGVEVTLQREDGQSRGLSDLHRKQPVSLVRLAGPVNCDLLFADRDGERDDIPLNVAAAEEFQFRPDASTGTFYGMDHRDYSDDRTQVVVTRMTDGQPEIMKCPELTVEFQQKLNTQTGQPMKGRMELGRILAVGRPKRGTTKARPVLYRSPDNGVAAVLMRLSYQVGARQLDMYDTISDAVQPGQSRSGQVALLKDGRVFKSSHIRVIHGDGTGIQRIDCPGPGRMEPAKPAANAAIAEGSSSDTKPEQVMRMQWKRGVSLRTGTETGTGLQTLTVLINGSAYVSQPARQTTLSGESIELLFVANQPAAAQPARSSDATNLSLDLEDFRWDRMTARGDVVINSPQVSGEVRDKVVVKFSPAGTTSDFSEVSRSRNSDGAAAFDEQLALTEPQNHVEFYGHEMVAHVIQPEDSKDKQQWKTLSLRGEVRVVRRGRQERNSFVAEGSTFIAENAVGGNADIQLYGSPAIIRSGAGSLARGRRIDLHQGSGTAEINGPGELKIVTDQQLNGRQLSRPLPVTISWTGHMHLLGQQAEIIGDVHMRMEDQLTDDDPRTQHTVVGCPELQVLFTQALELAGSSEPPAAGPRESPQVERLTCVGHTTLRQDSLRDDVPNGLLKGEMVDLTVWPQTGRFTAKGPGWIESTNPSDSEYVRLQPEEGVTVSSNAPAAIDETGFARMKARFVGELEGNFSHNVVSLRHKVVLSFVPVPSLETPMDLELMPADQMPKRGGLLKADQVDVEAVPGATSDRQYSLTAIGNASLYSRDFSGDADRITYDSSKELYELTADENRSVKVVHRTGEGGLYERFDFSRAHYSPRTNRVAGKGHGLIRQ